MISVALGSKETIRIIVVRRAVRSHCAEVAVAVVDVRQALLLEVPEQLDAAVGQRRRVGDVLESDRRRRGGSRAGRGRARRSERGRLVAMQSPAASCSSVSSTNSIAAAQLSVRSSSKLNCFFRGTGELGRRVTVVRQPAARAATARANTSNTESSA